MPGLADRPHEAATRVDLHVLWLKRPRVCTRGYQPLDALMPRSLTPAGCRCRGLTTLTIIGLHHAQITIPTAAEAEGRAFYCDLLQLKEIPKPKSLRDRGGFWLRVGEHVVHVGTQEGVERQSIKAHLAFEVTELKHWRRVLDDYGLEILESAPIPGCDRFECRDPFGNRLEFVERQT